MEDTKIRSETKTFPGLFYSGRFTVPWHQRTYDWNPSQVSDLLEDIEEALDNKEPCYFLGTMVLAEKSENEFEINDGQQRMISFSLIFACLCRVFNEQNPNSMEVGKCLDILFNIDRGAICRIEDADDLAPRITPYKRDKVQYDFMVRGKTINRNGKLTSAWNTIEKFIRRFDEAKAKKFLGFLQEKVEVSCLFIPKKINPNMIFEVINSRGKPLDDIDLIRNHIYSFFSARDSKQKRERVHEWLAKIMDLDKKAIGYVSCFCACEYGYLPAEKFYREVKKKIAKQMPAKQAAQSDHVYSLVERLAHSSNIENYLTMCLPKLERLSGLNKFCLPTMKQGRNIAILLQELKKYTVTFPIVFALLRLFKEAENMDEQKKCARAIAERIKTLNAFVMRTAFVSPKFEPYRYAAPFANFANKISNMSIHEVDILSLLREVDIGVISDKMFMEKLQAVELRDAARAKAFMLGLARQDDPNTSERNLTLEHVLPKSTTHLHGWDGFDEISHEENVYKIGNFALLYKVPDMQGNRFNTSFAVKKALYRKSSIKLTSEIADTVVWAPEQIAERQKRLVAMAAQIWKV